MDKEAAVQEELEFLLEQEDLKCRQKAKAKWLKDGDRNTKFFHASANQRRKGHHIQSILDMDGRLCQTQAQIKEAFISYYKELFTAGDVRWVEDSVQAVEWKVSPEMNQKLLADFTIEKISSVLYQMSPLKAPGPDGFPACFYQENWSTVHVEFSQAIL
jgi:hypothetical protein